MWKTVLTTLLIFSFLQMAAQRKESKFSKPSEAWWTIHAEGQILSGDNYISASQPAIGYGSGHTLLFSRASKAANPCRLWMGIDFNHHYFGRKQVNEFRVFYESWQLSFISRVEFAGNNTITPFVDFNAGLRLLVTFTANDRTYGGLLFRRFIDMLDRYEDAVLTDHKIIKEYDRFMPTAGIAGGFWLHDRKRERGLSLKGSVNIGTASKFADYRQIVTEPDTYNYIIQRGSGTFFNIQLGYSFRL